MSGRQDAVKVATGRWRGILSSLGVDARSLSGRHCPCPVCGGRDRFRFDDIEGRGTWFCSKCGAGDGFDLVQKLRGVSFSEAARDVLSVAGSSPVENASKRAYTDAQRKAALNQLWQAGNPIRKGDVADRYFLSRSIMLDAYPDDLRLVERCPVTNVTGVRALPAIIAMVRDHSGSPTTLHRTYLDPSGAGKADIEAPRRLMPFATGDGAHVRLGLPSQERSATVGVAEGLETALSAGLRWGIPTVSTINAQLLEKYLPPEGVKTVVIFGDHDESFAGQASAMILARKLHVKGLRVAVRIPGYKIDSAKEGMDWNDEAMSAPKTLTHLAVAS